MDSKETKVFKRLKLGMDNCSMESLTKYQANKFIQSSFIEIAVGDNITKWSIYIFPNGSDVESQSNIVFTLKLERNQHSKDFLVSGKFGLLGRNGKESNSKNIQEQTNKSYKPRNHVNSIMHDKLFDEHKDLIIDGKLTFFCDLTLSSIKGNKILLNPVPNPHEDYKKMFLNELFTDFELKTKDGEPLKVHKAILVARSPVFYAMLQNDMKEARESSAEVSGFDSMVVKELLRFIYYKEVEGLDKIAHDLLLAAEYYQVEELKKLCEATIISSLTVENVLTSLILADRLSATGNLFNECLDVIIRNFEDVSQTAEWKKAFEERPEFAMKITRELLYKTITIVVSPARF